MEDTSLEFRVESLEFENLEWEMGNGKWGMGNGEWEMGNKKLKIEDSFHITHFKLHIEEGRGCNTELKIEN
jgi:hypothetical protein